MKKPDIENYHQQDGLLSLTKVEPGKNKGSSPSPVFRWFLKLSIYLVFVNAFTSTMNWSSALGWWWNGVVPDGGSGLSHTPSTSTSTGYMYGISGGSLSTHSWLCHRLSWWFLKNPSIQCDTKKVTSSPYLFAVCRGLYYPSAKGLQ